MSDYFDHPKVGDPVTYVDDEGRPWRRGRITKVHARKGSIIGLDAFDDRWDMFGRPSRASSYYRGPRVIPYQSEHDAAVTRNRGIIKACRMIEGATGARATFNGIDKLTDAEIHALYGVCEAICQRIGEVPK